jgi:AcrR family transcriptional regulator
VSVPLGRARSARLPRPARRAQLLGAAGDVFVEQGYHAAAMDDIAEAAGVSKPVLYQHFPGKYELYLAVVGEHSAQLVASVRAALASTTDNKQRVAATIAAYFELVDRESQSFRLIFESDLTSDERVRELVDDVSRHCASAIAEVIQQDTHLPVDEAELLGIGLGGIANATARWWLRGGRVMAREDAVRLVTQLSWGGIREFPLWVSEAAELSRS